MPPRRRRQATAAALSAEGLRDKYFTRPEVLQQVAEWIEPLFVPDGDWTFVDCSAGDNAFGKLLLARGAVRQVVAYDIEPADPTVCMQDWLTVTTLPTTPCIIGLNPPYGYRGNMAKRFLVHAARLNPAAIVAIVPAMRFALPGFVETNRRKLPLDAFYLPGTGAMFEYPTVLCVWKRREATTVAAAAAADVPADLGDAIGARVACHVDQLENAPSVLLVRRVGYYAGRQCYAVQHGQVAYVHKGVITPGVSWSDNGHMINNSFWVVYFDTVVDGLAQAALRMAELMDRSAHTTREEDVKRAPSLRRSQLVAMLREIFL